MDLFGKKTINQLNKEIENLKKENSQLKTQNQQFQKNIQKLESEPTFKEFINKKKLGQYHPKPGNSFNFTVIEDFLKTPDKHFDTIKGKGDHLEFFTYILFQQMGYKTELTEINDHGVDIIATKGDERLIIQCKNFTVDKTIPNLIQKKHIDIFNGSNEPGQKLFIANTFFQGNITDDYPNIIFLDRKQLFDLIYQVVPEMASYIYFKEHLKEINIKECPACKKGYLINRKSKKPPFQTFVGCTNYPNCKHTEKLIN